MPYDDIRFSGWDDPDSDMIPLPSGGTYRTCCTDSNSAHVYPSMENMNMWYCQHCGHPHYADEDGEEWADENRL